MSLCINPQCQKLRNSDTTIFCQSCGSELLLDGRYRVLQELGQGGFGITYEVRDSNSRLWVLKVLMDNHPKYVELFQQEAQVISVLNHPGIPKIDVDGYFQYYCQGQLEPLHCLIMEKIEGLNLSDYIRQRGDRPIKEKRALRWLAELILILEQVHNKNFFHRDIKPANIMLRANGCLALIDFGTAREISNSYIKKKASGQVTGVVSQGYTPLEQMRGKAVLQSDFYALGGTMIFLLTAKNPGDFYDFVEEKIFWRQAVSSISPGFAELIDLMMASSPLERPQTSREIFNQIISMEPSLQILNDGSGVIPVNTDNVSTIAPTNYIDRDTAPNSSNIPNNLNTSTNSMVTPEFMERCRIELAEFIGPMASVICKRTLKKQPHLSQAEFCLTLAKNIADPLQARDFQQRIL